MALDLIGDERLRAGADRLLQKRHREVGDADVAGEALALCRGERRHAFGDRNLPVRPVDQQQVDVVDLQFAEARLDRAREVGRPQVLMRDLRGEENLLARHARGADAVADAALGAVFAGGIDVAVAEPQRDRNELRRALAEARRAEAHDRNLGAMGRNGGGRTHSRMRSMRSAQWRRTPDDWRGTGRASRPASEIRGASRPACACRDSRACRRP